MGKRKVYKDPMMEDPFSSSAASTPRGVSLNGAALPGNLDALTLCSESSYMSLAEAAKQHDESLDADEVNEVQSRLLQAVDAEHRQELREHVEMLQGTRECLEDRGTLLSGLKIVLHSTKDNHFMAYQPDGACGGRRQLPKQHGFKAKQTITILMDALLEDQDANDSTGDAYVEDLAAIGGFRLANGATQPTTASADEQAGAVAAAVDEHNAHAICMSIAETSTIPATAAKQSQIPIDDQATVGHALADLGLAKAFDGTVVSVAHDHMIIASRYDDALKLIESKLGNTWVICPSLVDVTFRRQRYAVKQLGKLLSRESSASPGRVSVSSDEVRVRQVLIRRSQQDVQAAAAHRVTWMTDSTIMEVKRALQVEPGLNQEQCSHLLTATQRTVTLMQGPPGTGKTRTLVAMVKALCHVFHDPGYDAIAEAYGFQLPSASPPCDWDSKQVATWLASLLVRDSDGQQSRMGIDKDMKEMLVQGVTMTGQQLLQAKPRTFEHHISDTLQDSTGLDQATADEFARKCVPFIMDLRDKLKMCLQGSQANAFAACASEQMRILVGAATNTAIDTVLMMLDKDETFKAKQYKVIRLGNREKMDERLDAYHIDCRRAEHPLMHIYNRITDALDDGKLLSAALSKEVEAKALQFAQGARIKAQQKETRKAVGDLLRVLADDVQNDVVLRIDSSIRKVLMARESKDHKAQRKAEEGLRCLRKEIRRIATYDIMLDAQVVLGTHISLGELHSLSSKYALRSPILVIDEAGQATEPSVLVPLTLGAEWVLFSADLKQLRPTIKTMTAKKALGYWHGGGSLYGRLVRRMDVPECTLHTQYRMHPAIREFPSLMFYVAEGGLTEDPKAPPDSRLPCPRYPSTKSSMRWWPFQRTQGKAAVPVAFFDVQGAEMTGSRSAPGRDARSYCNESEANVALRLLLLFGTDPSVKSIIILTPYQGQCKLLKGKLKHGAQYLDHIRAKGGFHPSVVDAMTVDGFQGQEADVVIVTTVRSMTGGRSIGHVADQRRLNVAITRAKRALLVVGNAASLTSVTSDCVDKGSGDVRNYWPEDYINQYRWIEWVQGKGSFINSNEVESSYLCGWDLPPSMRKA